MPRYGADLSDDGIVDDSFYDGDGKPAPGTIAYDSDLDHSDGMDRDEENMEDYDDL